MEYNIFFYIYFLLRCIIEFLASIDDFPEYELLVVCTVLFYYIYNEQKVLVLV